MVFRFIQHLIAIGDSINIPNCNPSIVLIICASCTRNRQFIFNTESRSVQICHHVCVDYINIIKGDWKQGGRILIWCGMHLRTVYIVTSLQPFNNWMDGAKEDLMDMFIVHTTEEVQASPRTICHKLPILELLSEVTMLF